ncbi:MAG: hypothetical protein POELPBGB_02247 [Bacteroidia bacterium]|nr:hypothetical protein [Bacteroidia bacterium]
MKIIKIVLILLLSSLIIIQFFGIKKNQSSGDQPNHISKQFNVSAEVETILKTSCYDCHSNNTVYPWYSSIQPVAWWLQGHVNEGREELNFDEFATYNPRRQFKKMEETEEMLLEGEMPLSSYIIIHSDAVLSASQKETITNWTKSIRQEIKTKSPGSGFSEEDNED